MDACGPRDLATEVVLCASSQSGKTECLNNFCGYIMDQDPGPILVIQPNQKPMAEAWSKDRLAPMVRDTPSLKDKVSPEGQHRGSKNTIAHKAFPGGHLTVGGANSPANLASRPIRYLLLDEIDRYEVTKEGHAIPLATRRTQTFWNKKILKVSSPTYEDAGILAELENCDQVFEWQLPCQSCGEFQLPRLKHFTWKHGDFESATYECEHCKHKHAITQGHKLKHAGKWIQTREGERVKVGFFVNQFGSALADWRETLAEFLLVKDDPEKLQVYVNTVLAEAWTEDSDSIEPDSLLMRHIPYEAEVPADAFILTAGVDIQDDRIEAYVLGWGEGEQCFFIDAVHLYGNTSQADVWNDLRDYLETEFTHETGAKLAITTVFIDSGFRSDYVYDFCYKRGNRTYAIKGIAGESAPMLGTPNQKRKGLAHNRRKVAVLPLGVDSIKAVIYSRLSITEPGPGYVNFPAGHGMFGAEFVAQLTAERRVTRMRRGHQVREWKQIRARNEALDCFVYAFAALRQLNPNFKRLAAQFEPEPEPEKKPAFSRTSRGRQRGGFAKRW